CRGLEAGNEFGLEVDPRRPACCPFGSEIGPKAEQRENDRLAGWRPRVGDAKRLVARVRGADEFIEKWGAEGAPPGGAQGKSRKRRPPRAELGIRGVADVRIILVAARGGKLERSG